MSSTHDLLIESNSLLIEIKAELSVAFIQMEKLEKCLKELATALKGENTSKRSLPAVDGMEEYEHKRLKAIYQTRHRSFPSTIVPGSSVWGNDWGKDMPTIPAQIDPVEPPRDSQVPPEESVDHLPNDDMKAALDGMNAGQACEAVDVSQLEPFQRNLKQQFGFPPGHGWDDPEVQEVEATMRTWIAPRFCVVYTDMLVFDWPWQRSSTAWQKYVYIFQRAPHDMHYMVAV